ncbi:MAG: hypothetical protein A2201_07910 [Alicyclobacillus sp. RIFOXYA1_FULL_53_8]|nr:MAG: hypothetical protein A2201_07910 [Alicyclobacillus sp. RIFOXYA1_FULL_53_8]
MDNSFSLYSLLIVAVLAVVVPLLVSRLQVVRIPIVVGEILVGVVFGKSGLNIIQQSDWLQFLQFFGLAYLMFISGLEIDLKSLRPKKDEDGDSHRFRRWWTNPPVFAVLTSTVTFVLAYLLSAWLYQLGWIKSPLMLALIITTTSLTVVVPVLKEYDVLSHSFGQLLLSAAVFADFATMLLISVAASLYKGGFSPSVLLVLVLISVLIFFYVVFRRFAGSLHLRNLAHGTAQLGIRASLALMIVFIVLSQTLGVQVILGTFLAGIFVGLVNDRERSDIYHKLDAIGFGFLIPIFFIMIGVDFDIRSLIHDPRALSLLPILLIATYLFKGLPALVLRLRYPWKDTLAGSILLTTQMSVTVAAAAVGLKIGAISPGVDTAIVLVAMLTSIISPILFGKWLPKHLVPVEREFVIAGDAPEAQLLVEQLRQRNEQHRLVDVHIDGTTPASVSELHLSPAQTKALVAYSKSDVWNIALAQSAVKEGFQSVICVVRDLDTFAKYRDEQKFNVIHPQFAMVTLIDQLIHFPTASQLLRSADNLQIQEIRLANRKLHNQRLRDLSLPAGLLVFSIVRDGIPLVPHGDTAFQVGDTVVVVGQEEEIRKFFDLATPKRFL